MRTTTNPTSSKLMREIVMRNLLIHANKWENQKKYWINAEKLRTNYIANHK